MELNKINHCKLNNNSLYYTLTCLVTAAAIIAFNLTGCEFENLLSPSKIPPIELEEHAMTTETPVSGSINPMADRYFLGSSPVILCYHGIAYGDQEPSDFVTHIDDFIGQINLLRDSGYEFIYPSQIEERWKAWKPGERPFALLTFDDGLESIVPVAGLLSNHDLPYGVAVIGRRQRRLTPQAEYASWAQLNVMTGEGTAELICHTYNIHHLGLGLTANGQPWLYPPLHAPQWEDQGHYLYMERDDPRPFWDLALVDCESRTRAVWAFPIVGTDMTSGETITSAVDFTAASSFTVRLIRFWLANYTGLAYDAEIDIYIDQTLVASSTVKAPWSSRELYTVTFDNEFVINEGENYTLTIETINTGNGKLEIYAIPDFTDKFLLMSNASGSDYPPGAKWPARPTIILGDGTGKFTSHKDYAAFIEDDLIKNVSAIQNYLGASWSIHRNDYEKEEHLQSIVLAGTYKDGTTARTAVWFQPEETFTADVMRFKYCERVGNEYALIVDIYVNSTKISRFAPNWHDWNWQEIDLEPYDFIKGHHYLVEFVTMNNSPLGEGLVRLYMNQAAPPEPLWNPFTITWIAPEQAEYDHTIGYKVIAPEHTDAWPSGIWVDKAKDWHWLINSPYTGPGKPFIDFLAYEPDSVTTPTQIAYPFGAYYSFHDGVRLDVHPTLKGILEKMQLTVGYTINPEPMQSYKDRQYSIKVLPRLMIKGNMSQNEVLDLIAEYGNISSRVNR